MLTADDRVLVIGGGGYVGVAFAELLEAISVPFAVYDNFSIRDASNIADRGWKYFSCDITDKHELAAAVREFKPTHIVLLAAIHFIPYCQKNPDHTIQVNIAGAQNVIDIIQAAKHKIELVFVSSAAVYYDSPRPLREDDMLSPIDIYGSSKLVAEHFIASHLQDYKIIRLFNVYGRSDPHPHLIPRLFSEMVKKPEEVQLGNIEPHRDYIHVDDVAAGILAVLSAGKNREKYNLGTGKTYSVGDVVRMLSEQIGHAPRVDSHHDDYARKSDRMMLCADISKITEHTGWQPKIAFADGLKTLR